MSLVLEFISTYIITASSVYFWYKILNRKIDFKQKKLYILLIISTIGLILNYHYINDYFRIFFQVLVMLIFCMRLLKLSLRDTIITVFFTEIIVIISEFIYVLFISVLLQCNLKSLIEFCELSFMTDLSEAALLLAFANISFIKKFYNKTVEMTSNIKVHQLLLFIFLLVISVTYVGLISYYSKNVIFTVVSNLVICFIYIVIIMMILHNKNKYNMISEKYNNSINDLVSYEKLVQNYKIAMHEDKNTLKTIQGMTKNKKVINYIAGILNQKPESINSIDNKLINIPSGGLKGLLHSKLSTIEDKKINYSIIIDKKIKYKDFSYIDDGLVVKICKVLGVFIDNAIDEVVLNPDYNIKITISKIEKDISFSVGNNYSQKIDINKLGHKHISSKGDNHGYGLMLVNKIVSDDNRLQNNTTFSKDYFEQELIVKNTK